MKQYAIQKKCLAGVQLFYWPYIWINSNVGSPKGWPLAALEGPHQISVNRSSHSGDIKSVSIRTL